MIDPAQILRLQSWFSPAFPIGAFSYSHGLEAAIEDGAVSDRESMTQWIRDLLAFGSGRMDAAFFVLAWRTAPDAQAAMRLALEAQAWSPTAELLLEADRQGAAFLSTVRSAWPDAALDAFAEAMADKASRPVLPVASGFVCGVQGVALETALNCYLHAFAANLVSAGVRLIPLGQTDGQIATAALEADILTAAGIARDTSSLDDVWSATPAHDIHSMQHETQYTRIFRS